MNFSDLLLREKLDPRDVLVFRHQAKSTVIRNVLPWLAERRPEVFNAFQQSQNPRVEKALRRVKYAATFLAQSGSKALFVGLYEMKGYSELTPKQFAEIPANVDLASFGIPLFSGKMRPTALWFDLLLTSFYQQWRGRMVIGWPPPDLSWWRRAHQNNFPILAIHQDSLLSPPAPNWHDVDLTWKELALLPASWASALSQWRGIYLIFDVSDGKAYVGSAYGSSNLLGRWFGYGKTGHGGNVLLKHRDPNNFRFSIIQRVSPDMEASEVVQLESSWKARLHTRSPHGLNDN